MRSPHNGAGPAPTLTPGLVSVQIPVRNGASFLEEAIRSVLAQQYPHWELIIADDGSSDASVAIARRYAARDPDRVRVLLGPDPEGTGISATRNRALACARGEFTAFLDADDRYAPSKLRRQVQALRRNAEAGIAAAPTVRWVRWNPEARGRDHVTVLGRRGVIEGPKALAMILRHQLATPATCAVLVRTELARQVGGFEEGFPGLYEDQVFYAKVLLEAPIVLAPRSVAQYRQHGASITRRLPQAVHDEARLRYLDFLEALLGENASVPGSSREHLIGSIHSARDWVGRGPAMSRARRFVMKRVRKLRSWTGV